MVTDGGEDPGGVARGVVQEGGAGSPSIRHHRNWLYRNTGCFIALSSVSAKQYEMEKLKSTLLW